MTDVDVDMESVINGGDDFDFEYDQDHDDETEKGRYSKYTDSCLDEKNDQLSRFSYLDIIPVKPRKIVATQSDFQQKFKTEKQFPGAEIFCIKLQPSILSTLPNRWRPKENLYYT